MEQCVSTDFEAVSGATPALKTFWSMVRSSVLTKKRVAQKGAPYQATGRSKNGLTIRILTFTDALGNVWHFRKTGVS
ncbi:hypothetical protein ABE530_16555 [Brucella sp. TWI559]